MMIFALHPAAASSGFLRESFRLLEALIILLILSCSWFCNGTLNCCTKEMAGNVVYNSYEIYEGTYNASIREVFISDLDPRCLHVNPMSSLGLSNTCDRSDLFCLPLPSSSFFSEEHDSRKAFLRSSDAESILKKKEEELLESLKSDMINLDASRCSLPMLLEVNPHLLDWGKGYLHLPRFSFLTVANRQKDNVLHVYKPFSTDPQFYACNYSGSLLDPSEVASICFVFHPRQLGLSSAQLVIQTSIGGFLVQGKGFAVIRPIEDETLDMPGIPFSGWWGKIVSLFSSLHMTVYAMEVKSSLPGFMLSLFKKILRGLSVRKMYAVSFLAVSLMFLKYCFTVPRLLPWIPKTYVFLGGNNSTPTVSTVGNSPLMHRNQQVSEFSISYKMDVRHSSKMKSDSMVRDSVDDTEHSVVATAESVVSQCTKSEPVNHSGDNISGESKKEGSATSPGTKSAVVLNADNGDAADIGFIAVKVGKEKRRKKKGKGPRAGVAASFESPGSQSGYSTPSSPLSPITTVLLPNKSAVYAKRETKKPRSPIKTLTSHLCEKSVVLEASPNASDMKLSVPKKVFAAAPKQAINKFVLFSSATFPPGGHSAQNIYPPYSLPPSSIDPHARAPGPKLCKISSYEASEKAAVVREEAVKDFIYDIWGDHFSGFDPIGRPKEPYVICAGNDSDSFSFFAKGPTLLEYVHPRYVSTFVPEVGGQLNVSFPELQKSILF